MAKSVSSGNAPSSTGIRSSLLSSYGIPSFGGMGYGSNFASMPAVAPSRFGYEADPAHERALILAMYNQQRGDKNYIGGDKKDYLKRVHEMPAPPPAKSSAAIKDVGSLTDQLYAGVKKSENVSYMPNNTSSGYAPAGRNYGAVGYN
jgi:hypothetical protein